MEKGDWNHERKDIIKEVSEVDEYTRYVIQ